MSNVTLVIKGWYGQKNFGDDLLLAALVNALRGYVDARIVLWCRRRRYLSRIAPGARILEPWTPLRQPVAILWGGGTQFFTFPGSDKRWSDLENIVSLFLNPKRLARAPLTATQLLLHRLRAARLHKVAWRGAIGIGVGPFLEVNNQMEEKLKLLRDMNWLSVRDEESLKTCEQYGIQKAILGADLAFLHPLIGKQGAATDKIIVIPRVSPMDQEWGWWEEALQKTLRQIRPDSIEVISLCEKDHLLAKNLATRLEARLVCWDPHVMSLDAMIERLVSA